MQTPARPQLGVHLTGGVRLREVENKTPQEVDFISD